MGSPPPPLLLRLTAYRWSIPVVAALGDGPARFGELSEQLAVGASALSRSLGALTEPGLVERPGRAAPYRLAPPGEAIAPACAAVCTRSAAADHDDLVFRRWSLPVIAALQGWSLRFGELRALLDPVTPRALATALKTLAAAGLVHRELLGGFPPSAAYRLTDAGDAYLHALGSLATDSR